MTVEREINRDRLDPATFAVFVIAVCYCVYIYLRERVC